jgi:N-6 DNA Methylase
LPKGNIRSFKLGFKLNKTTPIQAEPQSLQDELNEAAEKFAQDYAHVTNEKSEAQNFMRDLCKVYKLESRHAVKFEHRVKGAGRTTTNFVDGFFPGLLLVEMKTTGKDLDGAYAQAKNYVTQLKKPEEKPRHILVSDFQNLHLYDEHPDLTVRRAPIKFKLAEFRQHVNELDFLLGYERIITERQEKATIEAARRVGDLHDAIKATGYKGSDLQSLLVRLLFCMFADDTGLFDQSGNEGTPFADLMKDTQSDGRDLSDTLNRLFSSLDTKKAASTTKNLTAISAETKNFYKAIAAFPYVNGELFKGRLADCDFDINCRAALLHCCSLDWSEISPDIFGNLFQHIMHWDNEASSGKTKKRREFGAHYTSERNILRAIRPLFLDDLSTKLDECRGNLKLLSAFHAKLGELTFLDPACGCGNFLVVAYRELRLLEQQVLQALEQVNGGQVVNPICDVHQFYGIEIDPTAVEIATVAMWLTDHQMNTRLNTKPRIPLDKKASIVQGNALQKDWNEVLPATECCFIVGNPPFLGYTQQNTAQKSDMTRVFGGAKNVGVLDYVTAFSQMLANENIKAAFVSTNSITQGEQVAILWQPLMERGLHIHFAHRTFKWNNEGSGVAAVHCVIVGFGLQKVNKAKLWDYSRSISGDGEFLVSKRLNPYLIDAKPVWIKKTRTPISGVAPMTRGNQPTDGQNLLLDASQRKQLIKDEPNAKKWIKPFVMGEEFINNIPRYCLWLKGITKDELNALPKVKALVAKVKIERLKSAKEATRESAETSHLFQEIRQPKSKYLALPTVSSERRKYIPIGFLESNVICGNKIYFVEKATKYHFALMSSTMHNAWTRATAGRLKSDYNYSNTIVYNNYPWPQNVNAQHKKAIEAAGQKLLDARAMHEGRKDLNDDKGGVCSYSLAWAYNPETMPSNIQAAHDAIDAAVDEAYGYEQANDDAPRVAFLFDMYQKLTSLLPQVDDEDLGPQTESKPKRAAKSKLMNKNHK